MPKKFSRREREPRVHEYRRILTRIRCGMSPDVVSRADMASELHRFLDEQAEKTDGATHRKPEAHGAVLTLQSLEGEYMTRVQLHNRSVELVRRTLAARGLRVRHGGRRGGSPGAATRFDLIAEGVAIAVRVAKRSAFVYRVSVRGKRYTYLYAGYRWNLHSHGRTRLHPDFWILVAAGRPTRFFVVPGQRVRGSYTLTLRVPSHTWLLGCENGWNAIRELSTERHKKAA